MSTKSPQISNNFLNPSFAEPVEGQVADIMIFQIVSLKNNDTCLSNHNIIITSRKIKTNF